MLRMATDHLCGSVLPTMENQCLSIDTSEDDDSVDPKWCPPNPDAQDDPAEEELIGAAEKLDHDDAQGAATLQYSSHPRILVRYRLCGFRPPN